MKVINTHNLEHQNPSGDENYAYAHSAKVFETKQLFLYSEKVFPGKRSSAPHFHRSIDEMALVIKGELWAVEGDEEVLISSGDCLLFEANSEKKHYLENRSETAAEFLLFRRSTTKNDVIY